MYSTDSDLGLISSSTNMNSFERWNSHKNSYSYNDSFHQYNSRLIEKSNDNEIILEKFQYNTLVKLETGETKNIQQLTTNDFLISTKRSPQYSSLLARIENIGCVDKVTGKAELRFYITGIEKPISYYVSQEMPFFVHQHSCWSSISPEYTRRICGLKCRQLECGDLIIAITEQQKSSTKIDIKPDYTQQSPTKCLVERYMNEKISSSSSSKDNIISKNKRVKIHNE